VATTYTYLPGGTTHVVTTPAGTQTDSYDASLDLTATAYTGTATGYTAPTNTSYTYYVDGTRHTVTDGAGTTTTTYDAAGDTTSVALAATGSGLSSKTTSYTYYQNQARATTVYPTFGGTSTPTVTYTYDATGAEATLVDWLSHTITFSHDADANTTATLYPTTGTSTTTVTSSFDNADALTNVSAAPTSSPSSVIAGYATPRNGSEQVASETDSGSAITASTQSYGYSASNQLASVTAGTGPGTTNNASYDPANNPTTLAATSTTSTTAGATQNYDNAGELCWQDTAVPSPLPTDPNARCATASPTPTTGTTVSTYSYNQSGDRTATAAATTSGTTTSNYAYTQTDQLATFTPSTGSATTYTYNADGLRVSKTTASTTTQFVYDTAQSTPQVLEDPANAYIYGPTGTAVEQVSSAGTPTYYVTDQLGSTRALISLAATVVGTFTYGPTGTLMSSTGTLTSPLGFAGGYTDAETGFEYLVNRYYDPTSDQFLSVDTLVDSTKAPYYYASDNAVNYTDPTGNSTHGYCVGLSGAATTYVVNPSVGGFGCLLEDSSQNIGFSAMGYNSAGTRARGESVAGHVIDTLKSFLANGVIGAQASLLDMNTNSQTLDGLHGTWSMYGGTAGVGIHGGIGAGWTAGDIYRGSNSGFMIGLNVGVGFGLPLSYGGTSGFNVSANHPADLGTLGYKYYFYAGLLKGLDLLMWPLLNQFGLSAKEGVDGERQQVAACQR
jgi:RHS repeat-associated protein